jgi:hypothetical protein
MKRKPSSRILVALNLLSGNPDGVTEHVFSIVHSIDRRTLDAMVATGLAYVTVERAKQGFEIVRFQITEAGRQALATAPIQSRKSNPT